MLHDGEEFVGPFFRLVYPSHWESEVIEDVAAFFDPDEGGALQIAATVRPHSIDLGEEMAIYLARQGLEYRAESMAEYELPTGGSALICEFVKEERFWMAGMFGHMRQLLIVTYNADSFPDPSMAELISDAINSIQFLPS